MDDIKGRGNLRGAIAFHNSRRMLSTDRQLEKPVTGPRRPKSKKRPNIVIKESGFSVLAAETLVPNEMCCARPLKARAGELWLEDNDASS
jgi:hypothetical protein